MRSPTELPATRADSRARRGHSVGTKLLAVIGLSLAIVFGLIYVGLTSREKSNLLRAKQMAGEMVVDLFTGSVWPAILFDDKVAVSDALRYLGNNPEVVYAAVWKRDARKLGDRVAEFRRGNDDADYASPVTHEGRRVSLGADALTFSASVKEPSGTSVGQALVVFSLAREQKLFAELSQRILLAALVTAALIAIVLVGAIRALVVRRLSQLAAAAQQLERGYTAEIDRGADDEVGQLADALSKMAAAIVDREARIQSQNREMRLVLDNVAQGFITVGIDGAMSSERSAIVDQWFGPPAAGATLSSYLAPHAARYADWVEVGLEQLRDDMLPSELVLDQLPKRFVTAARSFNVTYTAICHAGTVQRLLVIISDVTAQLAHERIEREQKELVALFQRISIDRSGVEEFLTEAAGLVGAVRSERDPIVQQRLVHTLKGNCAIYGLESYAELAHRIESELAETDGALTDEHRRVLVDMWKGVVDRVSVLLGGRRRDSVEIERTDLDAFIERARERGAPPAAFVATLIDWTREPIELRFDRLGRQALGTARRLGKSEPKIEIDGQGIRLDPAGWAPFWSAMVHVMRNAVDHGIEDAASRVAANKPEIGTISFMARRTEGRLIISIGDDGKGIDWSRVKAKAAAAHLACETQADLVAALLADGFTTRTEVTDTSGRGVGLAALNQVVTGLGGEIMIRSALGHGTTFDIAFDELSVMRTSANAPASPPSSLMPSFG